MKHITKMNAQELKDYAHNLKGTTRKGKFKLFCGHSNGYQDPLYPFHWHCAECGQLTKEPIEVQ